MSSKLTKEEVLHVAKLARIKISDSDIEKYREELGILMESVSKINDVVGYNDDFIIAPFTTNARLRDDTEGKMIKAEEVLQNVPRKNGNYVEVPVVINE